MVLIDNAVHSGGRRSFVPSSLDRTFGELRACTPESAGFCWIGLLRPTRYVDPVEVVEVGETQLFSHWGELPP